MAKIKLENFSKELSQALSKAKSELLSPSSLQKIGDDLAEQIKVRTRLGNGLEEQQGEPSRLKPLSAAYVEQRKLNPGLSGFTTAKKSNLTFTGKMLDAIVAKVTGTKIVITFNDSFSKDKAKWNTESGRPFMAISRVQVERLQNYLNAELSKLLKKFL